MLRARKDPFLKLLPPSLSATYCHRRPSSSSQQINLKLELTKSSSTKPSFLASEERGGGGGAKESADAKLALIRSVSRTRSRASWPAAAEATAEAGVEDCLRLMEGGEGGGAIARDWRRKREGNELGEREGSWRERGIVGHW